LRADLGARAQKVTDAATKITVKPKQNPQTFIAITPHRVIKLPMPLESESPDAPQFFRQKIRRLKSALKFCVINYGLKPVA